MSENELLIIGNGFDLQAGLKSSVYDFYKYRYLSLRDEDYLLADWKTRCIKAEFSDDSISVWDLIILSQQHVIGQDTNWKDIELIIAETLKGNSLTKGKLNFKKDIFSDLNYVARDYDKILDAKKIFYSFSNPDPDIIGTLFFEYQLAFLIRELIMESKFEDLKEIFIKRNKVYKTKFTGRETALILKYLMFELHKFEKAFSNYLIVQTNSEEDNYIENSQELIKKLVKNDNNPISLLSFNYTTPFYLWANKINLRNIHGSLKLKNVIFGVDSNIINEHAYSMELFKFTKTSRILKLTSKSTTDNWSFGGMLRSQ